MMNTEPPNPAGNRKPGPRAAIYMMASVLLFSLSAICVYFGEAHKAPLTFNAIMSFFSRLGILLFLVVNYRQWLFDRETWGAVINNWRSWSLLGILVGVFDYTILGWSLKYIDISVATALFQTWPFWLIVLTGQMFKGEQRYNIINFFGWSCILMGLAGLMFVILSQTETLLWKNDSVSIFDAVIGQLLALVGAIFTGGLVGGCSIRWGDTVLKSVSEETKAKATKDDKDLGLFFVMIGLVIGSVPNIIIGASWGIHNEAAEFGNTNIIIAAVYGFFVLSAALIFSRMANRATLKLEVNALSYMVPVLSLAWLGILGYINVPKIDWLVIGAMGIVAANALLNFKAERRLAYQSLVVALWVSGVVVYFRSFFHAPVFYETVAVVTTMFILILSFRVDRLVRRTSDEDKLTLEIWQKISSLPKYMQDKLCEIDEAQTPKKLGEAHKDFHDSLKKEQEKEQDKLREIDEAQTPKKLGEAHKDFHDSLKKEYADNNSKFSDIMQQVNILTHSKQQGDNFGEHVVLWILGGISVGGLWFFMPEGVNAESGAGGFFLEMAAFLVTATVVFLLFNIQDLQQDRKHQVLRTKSDTENPDEKNKYEGLVFREDQDRTAARRISVVFCVGIVATFAVLFWLKWMPA